MGVRFAAFMKAASKAGTKRSNRFLCLALISGLVLTSRGLLGSEVVGQSSAEANIAYVDTQPLLLTVAGEGTLSAPVLVRNIGSRAGRAEFCTFSDKSRECIHNVDLTQTDGQVPAGQVVLLSIRIREVRVPTSGYLGLLTLDAGGKPLGITFRPLKVGAALFPQVAWGPLCLGLAIAILLCAYAARRLHAAKPRVPLSTKMGSPTWDFSRSWASNLTVVGAFLSTTLALSSLPELTRHISKGGYALLNVIFTLIVAIAPFVFNVIRKPILTDVPGADGSKLQYQGYVFAFLIASGITVWAVSGQMITLIILVDEFSGAGLAPLLTRLLEALIGILTLCVMLYAAITIFWTAKSQVIARQDALTKLAAAPGVRTETLEAVETSLPTWSLL